MGGIPFSHFRRFLCRFCSDQKALWTSFFQTWENRLYWNLFIVKVCFTAIGAHFLFSKIRICRRAGWDAFQNEGSKITSLRKSVQPARRQNRILENKKCEPIAVGHTFTIKNVSVQSLFSVLKKTCPKWFLTIQNCQLELHSKWSCWTESAQELFDFDKITF